MFKSEKAMSNAFASFMEGFIHSEYSVFSEVAFGFGIPDFVVIRQQNDISSIIAFELKIDKWKKALTQAYRYKTFANAVFVVLDDARIKSAIKHIDEFKHFNVGLASLTLNGIFKIFYVPTVQVPFSQHLTQRALSALDNTSDTEFASRFESIFCPPFFRIEDVFPRTFANYEIAAHIG